MSKAAFHDGCGCFPTGLHYAGIAHLLRAVARGLLEGFAGDTPWHEMPIALIDVETTGRDASADRIVEVGIAVGRAGEIVARYNWLIQPGVPISDEVRAVHGISNDDVKDAPRFEQVAHEIAHALEACLPAAYNAAFDRAFLAAEFARAASILERQAASGPAVAPPKAPAALSRDIEWLDPLAWAREIQSDERSRTLVDVAARLGVKLENAHRASDDAEAALRVMYLLATDTRIPRAYGPFIQEQRRLSLLQADERRRWKF